MLLFQSIRFRVGKLLPKILNDWKFSLASTKCINLIFPYLSWGLESVQKTVVTCGHQEIYPGVNLIQFIQYTCRLLCFFGMFWHSIPHTGIAASHKDLYRTRTMPKPIYSLSEGVWKESFMIMYINPKHPKCLTNFLLLWQARCQYAQWRAIQFANPATPHLFPQILKVLEKQPSSET